MNPWINAIITAIGFGGWPLMTRLSSASPLSTSIAVLVGTLVTLVVASLGMSVSASPRTLIIPILAGILNGIGFIAYVLLNMNKQWAPMFVPISLILMIFVITIGGVIFYGDRLSLFKIVGTILALVAVWLMTK